MAKHDTRRIDLAFLAFAGLILGFTAFSAGGVTPQEWSLCLLAVCALSLAVWLPERHWWRWNAPPDRWLMALLILLPCYVGLQLLPLPGSWLRVLSPARAELQNAVVQIGLGSDKAPLSASPALTMAHLLRVLCFICFFFLIRELTRRFSNRSWIPALPVIAIAAGEAALGLVQYFAGAGHATGTWVNQNHYSCFLQMALPFPLILAALAIRPKYQNENLTWQRTVAACALIGCAALIFLGALYSMSRMGAAATAVSLIVLAGLSGTRKSSGRSRYLSAGAAVAGILLILFFSVPGALLARLGNQNAELMTADVRGQIWRETLHMAADYRIFGSGLGTYASVFQKYRVSVPLYLVDFAHNDYLQLLAELGVIGFAIAAAAALMILIEVAQSIKAGPTRSLRWLAIACAAALVALLMDSAADFDFYIPANAMLAAWIAGMGTAGVGNMGLGR